MDFDTSDIKLLFFEESEDLLTQMESALLQLEQTPDDPDTLNQIFRCAHSIKGGSGSLGLTEIAMFTHGLETLLDQMRHGKLEFKSDLAILLLECSDHLHAMLDAARADEAAPDSAKLLTRIEDILDGNGTGDDEMFDEEALRAEIAAMMSEMDAEAAPSLTMSALADVLSVDVAEPILAAVEVEEVVAPTPLTMSVVEPEPVSVSVPEPKTVAPIASVEELTVAAVVQAPIASAKKPAKAEAAKGDGAVLRISADKVDKLINLVGELVIHQAMLVEAAGLSPTPEMAAAVSSISQSTRELQERVLAVRMLPIKQLFGRFPRTVHDLARSCGKSVELVTSGEETEIDKTVIDGLGDPITHLIRNSVDHGLETAEERALTTKPSQGTVYLRARQEGGNIVIEVGDDGKGLNRERIIKKAIENGIIEPNTVLTDEQVWSLIYQPGFSTAAAITDVSGRGVGMDIVVQSIRALGGTINVTSVPGQGTCFRVKLPLTMAIIEGLSVRVGNELYVLPLSGIVECIQSKPGDVHVIAGKGEVLNLRSSCLPVLRMHQLFGVKDAVTDPSQGVLVIVEDGERRLAVLVDELIGQYQVVVKSLQTNYGHVQAVAGATILGDGRVALIIDISGLPEQVPGRVAKAA